jgi:hypothetical protein
MPSPASCPSLEGAIRKYNAAACAIVTAGDILVSLCDLLSTVFTFDELFLSFLPSLIPYGLQPRQRS